MDADQLAGMNAWLTAAGMSTVSVGDSNPLILRLNDFDLGGAAFRRTESMNGCG